MTPFRNLPAHKFQFFSLERTQDYFMGENRILFRNSLAEKILQNAEESDESEKSKLSTEEVQAQVMEVRALVGRLSALKKLNTYEGNVPEATEIEMELPQLQSTEGTETADWSDLFDPDLSEIMVLEENPDLVNRDEVQQIRQRLETLLKNPQVAQQYEEMFGTVVRDFTVAKRLLRAYKQGYRVMKKGDGYEKYSLTSSDKIRAARQLLRILDNFEKQCREEEQNIHTQVKRSGRDYSESDRKNLERVQKRRLECRTEINTLLLDAEVWIAKHIDDLAHDRAVLQRRPKGEHFPPRNQLVSIGRHSAYIEVESRTEQMYGNESAGHSILPALRAGHNVELLGPTGTGKTKLGIASAQVFSNKNPVVVSGGPELSRDTFFGFASDVGVREQGACIQCMREGMVMILDEDNRTPPEILGQIKFILGLKAGDVFMHPDTGEEIVVQPGFGVMVTRNEKDEHHEDRFDLPPDYRREFTHGSFEIDYYTPAEMYHRFFSPKLSHGDNSIPLSDEEIGGTIVHDTADLDSVDLSRSDISPLLALCLSAKQVQTLYKTKGSKGLENAVFESGFLIDLFDEWAEMSMRQKSDGSEVAFLEFLETKLIEFLKRPIGSPDRKKIIPILVNHGFFRRKNAADFATPNEGEPLDDMAFQSLLRSADVRFQDPTGNTLNDREVATLNPFGFYEIPEIPDHPLKPIIEAFAEQYRELCSTHGMRAVSCPTDTSFNALLPRIIQSVRAVLRTADASSAEGYVIALDKALNEGGQQGFLEKTQEIFDLL